VLSDIASFDCPRGIIPDGGESNPLASKGSKENSDHGHECGILVSRATETPSWHFSESTDVIEQKREKKGFSKNYLAHLIESVGQRGDEDCSVDRAPAATRKPVVPHS
jgi:hypothetical protein